MLDDWGFFKRGKAEYEESIEEMQHADKLIKRILLLGGLPNLQDLGKLYIGENLKELIECDYRLELEGIDHYRKAIGICEAAQATMSAVTCWPRSSRTRKSTRTTTAPSST